MNSTSFFYNHSSQWRYEKVSAQELLSPLADASKYSGHLMISTFAPNVWAGYLLRRSWGVTRSGLKLKPTRPDYPPQNLPPRR
ncbi:respiratory nitrate reductase 2 alpha chain [Escherichia coli]|uniref:Respiratory nitrate reductase 2 alpha chain n=1 Tax=Escherichia coli TaxID=562 RepID=A0A376TFX4_ECOLX|nr:respiratory nitrate reductase 2 alpha chain [Escherichia coli]